MIQRVYYVKIPGKEMNNMFPVLIQEIGAYIYFKQPRLPHKSIWNYMTKT